MARDTPLTYDDGPMVWVDCEMTGLDTSKDVIIEIAVIITDGHLNPVDDGICYVINTDKALLDGMDEWCQTTHGNSGLIQQCLDSPYSYADVAQKVLEYIQKWIPEKGAGLLAGSTVHADMRFLLIGMPEVMKHLSYRIVDVSSVKEIARRWYPQLIKREKESRQKESAHRINELKFYREHIFQPVEPIQEPSASDTAADKPAEPRKTAL
ncbi:hypothetical protein A1Q2_05819 [Trichosporon asahii var. asahii CBS 8904]|uniref:Exonuclease domain-containing protein n=1 Tax=Trichosporon asahii var. asahii (strain CBS 8904) TaxID=1220162 RepID=K1V773_TRIAC|nr:hypothetical protein A1Q2_05819 [Trichosporon asahii var. asahii CBS 8904]